MRSLPTAETAGGASQEEPMPTVTLPDGAEIFYRVDDFSDPWRDDVETVMLVHGFCRNSDFW